MKYGFWIVVSLAVLVPSGRVRAQSNLSRPKKGVSLQRVAERQRSPDRGRLDAAVTMLKKGAYSEAAVKLHDILAGYKDDKKGDEARYNLAKALYRMGMYRSALDHFARLLSRGQKSRFFESSLQWCLFLSRKMNDDGAVSEAIARYGAEDFPAEYADEFSFRLARFHFDRALAIERGELGAKPTPPTVEENAQGRKSIKGDVFGDLFDEDPRDKPKGESKKKRKKRRSGGSISLDVDPFADPPPPPPPPPTAPPKTADPDAPWLLTADEHAAAARRWVARVGFASKFGARARFLEGVVLYHAGEANAALEAFKDVVRATKAGEPNEDPRLRRMAFFQLARTHFGAEQPSFAIAYYDKVDPDSYAWLDALFEQSWAEFRLGNYEKVLGNLMTLHAPFFEDTSYPESLILKAVVYYESCRYAEADRILKDFLARYEPVHNQLKALTAKAQSEAKFYEDLGQLRAQAVRDAEDGRAPITGQVVQLALADPELERLDRAYREVALEMSRLARVGGSFPNSALARRLKDRLSATRSALATKAGRAVKNQLERERRTINELIQQAIRIQIETARSEQERIESQLRAAQQRPNLVRRPFIEWTDDERLVWPFEGEYWRDELGTYELTLAHSCR